MTKQELKEKILKVKIRDNFNFIRYIKRIISENDEPIKENTKLFKELLFDDIEIKEEIRWRSILFIVGYTNVIFTSLKMYTYSFGGLHLIDLRAYEESMNYEYDDDEE